MTAATSVEIDSQHTDMVHDAQFDFYAKQLATCSSDKTIRIHQVDAPAGTQPLVLQAHTGPVWQVCWSHPVTGSLLASCSYDGKVIIWKNGSIIHEHTYHSASGIISIIIVCINSFVNSIAFAPHEFGLILGCASSDGQVSIVEYTQDKWSFKSFLAHSVGVNSISFTTATEGDLMCVTGGCDNLVKDKTAIIWTSSDLINWEKKQVIDFTYPLWRVSWSMTGHLLAIAGTSDNAVIYGVDSVSGKWAQVSTQQL